MGLILALVISHILFVAGCYLFTAGLMQTLKGSASTRIILTSPIFWGILMVLGGDVHDIVSLGFAPSERSVVPMIFKKN